MSKSLKKLIDINRLREFKNKLVGTDSPYVQTGAVDQTVAGTKTFSKPIVGSVTGSSGSCTGNAATATTATTAKACTGNAATATKLQTARTINGTSFNGTANITTANWGTARDITIADSTGDNTGEAVSVNGSAAVTLKLPATIKASLDGNAATATSATTATTATDATYTNWLRTSSHSDHLFHTEWDHAGYFWTYVTAGNGDYRAVRVARSDSAATAQACTGNAATATKLATAHTIALSGAATGTATGFDGSGDITIPVTSLDASKLTGTASVSTTGNAATATTATTAKACTGNAATATKLQTARTINGTSFNGTANITTANWGTARDITIADSTGDNTGEAVSVNGSAAVTLKLPATIKASLDGNAATATSATTAASATTATTAKACTGNAATATKLATTRAINGTNFDGSTAITTANWGTARNISISDSDGTNTGTAVSVNGSGNATLKLPATIKASITGNVSGSSGSCTGNAASATITKGNKNTGSYVTSVKSGNALVNADNTQFATIYNAPTKNYRVGCATWPDNGENIVWYSITNANVSSSTNTINKSMTWNAETGILTANGFAGPLTGNVTGNCSGSSGSCTGNAATATTAKACTGNAATATKLATARSLWGNNFDGSAAITGAITGTPAIELMPKATTANNGGFLDFHYNQSTADYTSRIIESASGTLSINNVTITTGKVVTATTFNGALKGNVTGNCSGSSGSCTGNAATATKLSAKRTIALSGAATGTATSFDGSGNITIPVTSLDASKLTGTASVSTTGNAATATTATKANALASSTTPLGNGLIYTTGGLTLGSSAGQLYKGSSNNAALISAPENGTYYNSTAGNVQNLRLAWSTDGKYLTDIFASPNSDFIWHRNVSNGTAKPWRRLVEENATGITAPNWDISIAGSSGSCTGNAATATKLAAKRTIALSGAATGTATAFDGSGNITIPVTSLDASKLTGTASVSTTGNAATATTAANGVDSSGSNWIRFRNGIQICWAQISCHLPSLSSTWTYGASFSSTPIVTVCGNSTEIHETRAGDIGTTSCVIVMVRRNTSAYINGDAHCIAIGRWK